MTDASKQPVYGYCPICGMPGKSRERRPNGNDQCYNNHIYKSFDSINPSEKIQRLESELELYKKALTMAVQLPMGVIPHDKEFYTQMTDGLCVVKRSGEG